MSRSDEDSSLPPGRPPWDTWNGLRIGALVGGIIAILAIWMAGSNSFWLALVGAVIGGVLGYLSEHRKLTNDPKKSST